MASTGSELAWYQDPDFVAARNHVVPPEGLTAYVEPTPAGPTPADVTEFVYGQATWSSRHMPNILYRLRTGAAVDWNNFKRSKPPGQKHDAQGQPMWERWPARPNDPQPILDFEILPDRIGTNEHWWKLEAWRRLDPRIKWKDISMRMSSQDRPSDILLRSRVSRPRIECSILSWFLGSRGAAVNDTILGKLSAAQRQNNTTRGSTPGLIDPALGRAGGRVYWDGETAENDTESEAGSDSEIDSRDEEDLADILAHATQRSNNDTICTKCRVYLGIETPPDDTESNSLGSSDSSDNCIHCRASEKLLSSQEMPSALTSSPSSPFASDGSTASHGNTAIDSVTENPVADGTSTRATGGKRSSAMVGDSHDGEDVKRRRK